MKKLNQLIFILIGAASFNAFADSQFPSYSTANIQWPFSNWWVNCSSGTCQLQQCPSNTYALMRGTNLNVEPSFIPNGYQFVGGNGAIQLAWSNANLRSTPCFSAATYNNVSFSVGANSQIVANIGGTLVPFGWSLSGTLQNTQTQQNYNLQQCSSFPGVQQLNCCFWNGEGGACTSFKK